MNIAQRFDFKNWRHAQTGTDHQFKTVTIEEPANWHYIYVPGLNKSKGPNPDHIDYWLIPQSLHRDDAMVIAAGWRVWQAGYKQRVTVQKGQRYTLVAELRADFEVSPPRPEAIEWCCIVEGSVPAAGGWSSYDSYDQRNKRVSVQTVFEPQADGVVDLVFWSRSLYADNQCDLYVYDIRCEQVSQSYASDQVVKMYPFGTYDPLPDPPPAPEPAGSLLALIHQFIQWLLALLGIHRSQNVEESIVQTDNVFKSKRFWSALLGLVMMIATSIVPGLEENAETLVPAILVMIGLLIGGYTAEDVAQARRP